MMRYEPTLIVTRMVVQRADKTVYDELFHAGLNVVRGENSSGKSTVLNFIFYGLGGDLTDWSTVARLCSRITLEVNLNGNKATLSREVSDTSSLQPMDIFGGAYVDSVKAPQSDWTRFPYRSGANRESFSQAIFGLLGIPEVSSDLSGHITMHQILRLLYADQLSPVENIFRAVPFDRADLRDTVGRLLCGAYDSTVYDNEQKIREISKEFDTINGQLKSLFSVLGKADQGFTFEWIDAQRKSLEQERVETQRLIEEAEQKLYTSSKDDKLTLAQQDKAYKEFQSLQATLIKLKHDRDALALTIADSAAFLAGLANKLESLRDSSKVADHIGEVRFQCCPACYTPIDGDLAVHACQLCKTPFDSEQTRSRISALIIDTGLQIKESELLQSRREQRALDIELRIRETEAGWKEASRRLASLQSLPSTNEREQLRELHRKSGYVQRQIEDLDQKAELAATIRELSDKKIELQNDIAKLRATNEALRAQQSNNLAKAYTNIAEEVKALLDHDLKRQDIFENPQSVNFTFEGNHITVDGESYFSASSRAILRSSFFLGFFAAATKNPTFRHPRFCMIDSHENMGRRSYPQPELSVANVAGLEREQSRAPDNLRYRNDRATA
jgi:DNA repair exonuclease SbcCD ATPase subunit